VFITSKGEYIVYSGYDPAVAANWSLVGRYYYAPPIGRRCTFNYGGELLVLTTAGIVPLTAIMSKGGAQNKDTLTYKLGKYFAELTQYKDVQGWQIEDYPGAFGDDGYLLLNCPRHASRNSEYYQFAMNRNTGSWCRFRDQQALCWTVWNGKLYYGSANGEINQADTGYIDGISQITFKVRQAWDDFDDGVWRRASHKQWHMANLLIATDSDPELAASIGVDYLNAAAEELDPADNPLGGYWDISDWDTTDWGGAEATRTFSAPQGAIGTVASLSLQGASAGSLIKWYATNYVYQKLTGMFG
jgi:hypothetical protein